MKKYYLICANCIQDCLEMAKDVGLSEDNYLMATDLGTFKDQIESQSCKEIIISKDFLQNLKIDSLNDLIINENKINYFKFPNEGLEIKFTVL